MKQFPVPLLAFSIILVFLSGCTSYNQQADDTTSGSATTQQPKTYNVGIKNFGFDPSELKIKTGDSVIWTNRDSTPHTVTSDSGAGVNSQTLSEGQTYSYTFNQPGTYNYHCSIHPDMKGVVTVE